MYKNMMTPCNSIKPKPESFSQLASIAESYVTFSSNDFGQELPLIPLPYSLFINVASLATQNQVVRLKFQRSALKV